MPLISAPPFPTTEAQAKNLAGIETRRSGSEVFRALLDYFLRRPSALTMTFLSGLVRTGITLFIPWLVGRTIDSFVEGQADNLHTLRPELWLFAGLIVVLVIAVHINNHSSLKLINGLTEDLRSEGYEHLLKLPLSRLDRWSPGEIVSRLINDIDVIKDGLGTGIFSLAFDSLTLVGSLLFLVHIHWVIALVVLALTPLCVLVTYGIAKFARRYFDKQQQLVGEMTQIAQEDLEQAVLVRALGRGPRHEQLYREKNDKLYVVGQRSQYYSSLTNPGARFVNNMIYLAVGLVATLLAVRSHLSYGEIAAALTYTIAFSGPVNSASALFGQVQKALAAGARVLAYLEEPAPEPDESHELQISDGEVRFEAVDFSYTPDKSFYENFTLEVRPGSTLAIVGPTGGGKTTLVNLLMRFYATQAGEIYLDGQPLSKCSLDSLYRQVGMVLQDTWLFSGTVAENLSYGRPEATREEIIEAAKATHAHDFIVRLPQGYDTVLEKGGGSLSQGQRQLLTVARVLLMEPKLMILDEATSNVDTRTEQKVQQAFLRLMKNRTSLIIAHRLATIRHADQIIVIDDGKLVERGTHESLMEAKGFYYEMYMSQFEGNASEL